MTTRTLTALLVALAIGQGVTQHTVAAQAKPAGSAPAFEVDPMWPKPLPNHWVLGSVTGVTVDGRDHVWITHRGADSLGANEKGMMLSPPTSSVCCVAAPGVLEFDAAGTLLAHWGAPGQGYQWPQTPAGIAVDAKGNVWITAAGNPPAPARRAGPGPDGDTPAAAAPAGGRPPGPAAPPPPQDAQVLKFSPTGQFLLQIGKAGQTEGSASKTSLNRPAAVTVDSAANEVYVADGYGNHRVVVFDAETGAYKRHWGAYGSAPEDAAAPAYDPAAAPAKQFREVTCVEIAKDGMVYVCDRGNDRIQVFQKDGKFVKEAVVAKPTLGYGSVWDVAFSSDPQQRWLLVADGQNKKVLVLDRSTLEMVGSFGDGGRNPGRFLAVGSVAVDSKGIVYTGENFEGKRVQRWIPGRSR